MKRLNIKICGISETHCTGSGRMTSNRYTLWYCEPDIGNKHEKGVNNPNTCKVQTCQYHVHKRICACEDSDNFAKEFCKSSSRNQIERSRKSHQMEIYRITKKSGLLSDENESLLCLLMTEIEEEMADNIDVMEASEIGKKIKKRKALAGGVDNTRRDCERQKRIATIDSNIPNPGCWSRTPLIHYPGLTQSPYHDEKSCLEYCISLQQCNVVDYNTAANPPCFVQTAESPVDNGNLRPHGTNVNYILNRSCVMPDKQDDFPSFYNYPCWVKSVRTTYPALKEAPYYNIDSCLGYCVSLDNCLVVDFDHKADPPCFVQSAAASVNLDSLTRHPSRVNFMLDRNCLEPNFVPYSVELCWARRENYHYKGLKNMPYNNLPSCLNYCASFDSCFMVDYDPKITPPCFVWEDQEQFDPQNFENHTSADNFLLDRECLSYFDYSKFYSSELCWTVNENSKYSGLEKASYKTEDSCLNHCSDSPKCSIVDYNPKDNPPCWIQTDGNAVNLSNLNSKESVTNYILDKTCE
ncbi:hypothetical protein HELRODRAFT_162581 [Helobdella robusta]|uniref:Apple domain-containing protein n=1 Tax=Helobdella robusta TaxID=6412 RepID=T1ESV5_HELRO|nr:hypothetical protein HELRODRAFT_162581 [Helobdella robusta]ESN99093.1 hypothetical protein HELRODRAFT_162581 [Helobdella robusta]